MKGLNPCVLERAGDFQENKPELRPKGKEVLG